ncbi:MAG: hypothetical protein ACFFDT_37450, partial [Candidatus Hodarchaeota archaeon]
DVRANYIFRAASSVLTLLLLLLIFQRIWAFLILQGSNPDLSFKNKLLWTKRTASRGQFGFILLLLAHISIQALIFMASLPPNTEIIISPQTFTLDPLLFLIVTGFEVGCFLFFIIYQLVKFSNQGHLLPDGTPIDKAGRIAKDKTPIKPKPTPVTEILLPSGKPADKDELIAKKSNPHHKTSNEKK